MGKENRDARLGTNSIKKAKARLMELNSKEFSEQEIDKALEDGENLEPKYSWGGWGAIIETIDEL